MKSHSDYEINDPPQLKKMPKYQLTLKKNLYDNNIMLDHEGNILCRCSKKKINWYVSRGLATIVNEVQYSPIIHNLYFIILTISN